MWMFSAVWALLTFAVGCWSLGSTMTFRALGHRSSYGACVSCFAFAVFNALLALVNFK